MAVVTITGEGKGVEGKGSSDGKGREAEMWHSPGLQCLGGLATPAGVRRGRSDESLS